MIKTKHINFKDYYFSFWRGGVGGFRTIFIQLLKCVFNLMIGLKYKWKIKNQINFDMSQIENVLIYIPKASGLGDMIMAGPFFQNLRDLFPSRKIILMAKSNRFIYPAYFDDFVDISKMNMREQLDKTKGLNNLLILLPEKSVEGANLLIKRKPEYFLGYLNSYKVRSNFLASDIEYYPNQEHYFRKSFNLLKAFDNKLKEPKYTPEIPNVTNSKTVKNPYIVFIPSVLWETRSIDFSDARKICQKILSGHQFQLVLSGGNESKDRIDKLMFEFDKNHAKIRSEQNLSLDEFVALIRFSSGVICGDSGPMHIAFSMQIPVFSYWGPVKPSLRMAMDRNPKDKFIFEESKCKVKSCYNMEHPPFCKTCLRLEQLSSLDSSLNEFLDGLS